MRSYKINQRTPPKTLLQYDQSTKGSDEMTLRDLPEGGIEVKRWSFLWAASDSGAEGLGWESGAAAITADIVQHGVRNEFVKHVLLCLKGQNACFVAAQFQEGHDLTQTIKLG